MEKDRMFQYYKFKSIEWQCIEDTGLITKEEAYELLEKYKKEAIEIIKSGTSYQIRICIWKNCSHEADYYDAEIDIDTQDRLVVEGNSIYILEKRKIC